MILDSFNPCSSKSFIQVFPPIAPLKQLWKHNFCNAFSILRGLPSGNWGRHHDHLLKIKCMKFLPLPCKQSVHSGTPFIIIFITSSLLHCHSLMLKWPCDFIATSLLSISFHSAPEEFPRQPHHLNIRWPDGRHWKYGIFLYFFLARATLFFSLQLSGLVLQLLFSSSPSMFSSPCFPALRACFPALVF